MTHKLLEQIHEGTKATDRNQWRNTVEGFACARLQFAERGGGVKCQQTGEKQPG